MCRVIVNPPIYMKSLSKVHLLLTSFLSSFAFYVYIHLTLSVQSLIDACSYIHHTFQLKLLPQIIYTLRSIFLLSFLDYIVFCNCSGSVNNYVLLPRLRTYQFCYLHFYRRINAAEYRTSVFLVF